MARYGNLFEAAAAGLGSGLGEGIPGAMAYSRQRKDKLSDLEAQRQYLAQQKQDQMDFMDRASRQRMAEGLLAQTDAPAGDIMEALPVASDPSQMDRMREYLSKDRTGLYGANRGLPGPFPGLDPFSSVVKSQNVAGTLGMKRQRFSPYRSGGRPKTFDDHLKAAIGTRNATVPLDQLRPFTREEVKTMGLQITNAMGHPLTPQQGQLLERLVGTTGGR